MSLQPEWIGVIELPGFFRFFKKRPDENMVPSGNDWQFAIENDRNSWFTY